MVPTPLSVEPSFTTGIPFPSSGGTLKQFPGRMGSMAGSSGSRPRRRSPGRRGKHGGKPHPAGGGVPGDAASTQPASPDPARKRNSKFFKDRLPDGQARTASKGPRSCGRYLRRRTGGRSYWQPAFCFVQDFQAVLRLRSRYTHGLGHVDHHNQIVLISRSGNQEQDLNSGLT